MIWMVAVSSQLRIISKDSEPYGGVEQDDFRNSALLMETRPAAGGASGKTA